MIRYALLPLVALLAACSSADESGPSLEMEGETLTFALDGRRVAATIGGEPVDAVFDTGAPGFGITQQIAEARGLEIGPDAAGETYSSLPAFGIIFRTRPATLDQFEIGGATFRDIPVGVGYPSDEDAAVMRAQGISSDIIFGQDLFRPHFRTLTFDYGAQSVTVSKRAPTAPLSPASLTDDGKYVVEVELGGRAARMLVDTGSKNNTVSPEFARGLPCYGYRRYQRSWGAFEERLLPLTLSGDADERRWVQVRDFATDPERNIIGVLGEINGGRLTLDLREPALAWDWSDAMEYAYAPTEISETCPEL